MRRLRTRRILIAAGAAAMMCGLLSCTTTMDRTELAAEYYNLGTAFFDLGDLTRSADYLARAIELDPGLARASYNLALVYAIQGRYDEAAELLESLRAEDPSNTVVLQTLGYVEFSRGNLAVAATMYDQVISIDPGSVDALYNRAKIATAEDDWEGARDLLALAVERSDSDAGVLELLATAEEEIGDTDGAIAALERLKALGSISVDAQLQLAELYEDEEHYDLALEELQEVIASSDQNDVQAVAQFRKGRILLTAADEPEAGLEALRAALQLGYSDSDEIELLRDDPRISDSAGLDELLAPVEGDAEEAPNPEATPSGATDGAGDQGGNEVPVDPLESTGK